MTRRLTRIARLLTLPALLALSFTGTPAASAGNPCFHGYDMPPSTTEPGTEVKLMPCAFQPTVTVVAVGTAVSFFNGPDYTHLITGAAQEWGSPDVEIQPNQTVTYTFDTAGVYPYACVLHPGMSGAIVVGDLADVVAAGTTDSSTGGSTGRSAGDDAGTAEAPAPASTSVASDSTGNNAVLVGVGTGAGLIAGAALVWLATRRRPATEGALVRAE
jgi:plastocyanin